MEQIPVIDVSPFTSGDPSGKEDVARQLATACEHTGFFCITGHGVDESLIRRTRQAGADFFARPMMEKSKILRAADRTGRGYYPPADRALAKTLGVDTPPDLQEAWVMSPEAVPETPYFRNDTANYFFGPNLWPEGMPAFRETMLVYFEAMAGLGRHMMAALALALRLDEDFFIDKFDKATNQFRIIHYPPQNTRPEPGQLRAGAHTDYGALTMLRGDDVPGTLQIKVPKVGWIDVRPPPDGFVCNLGDAMARWTGGRWASTLHRVANPPSDHTGGRMTLVFFHQPNYDTLLAGLADSSEEPVTMGEHFVQKIHAAVDTTTPAVPSPNS